MRQRGLLHALIIPILLGGCMVPSAMSPAPEQPPPGAMTAAAAFPPIGARWMVRVSETRVFQTTVADMAVTAIPVDFEGRRGYGIAGPTTTMVFDPVSFNPIGTLEQGRVAVTDTPDTAWFSWPLWVGKSWESQNSRADRRYGTTWLPAKSKTRVAAFEDVSVPAGTFKAFRIEHQEGIGSTAGGGPRSPPTPGFESNATYWYAPDVKMIVKSDVVRGGTNYRSSGRTITEVLSLPR